MQPGAFSISLSVRDLAASLAFYEALGFARMAGEAAQGWVILTAPGATIGLFQGMIPANTLTFNPGWDAGGRPVDPFTDVREIQRRLRAAGIVPSVAVDEDGSGPGWLMLTDPDGNPVLIDQHR